VSYVPVTPVPKRIEVNPEGAAVVEAPGSASVAELDEAASAAPSEAFTGASVGEDPNPKKLKWAEAKEE